MAFFSLPFGSASRAGPLRDYMPPGPLLPDDRLTTKRSFSWLLSYRVLITFNDRA